MKKTGEACWTRWRRRIAGALVALLVLPGPAAAWNEIGHKVVAALAWRHMKPETRQRAVELLRAAPADAGLASLYEEDARPVGEREREFFLRAATWADRVRDPGRPENAYHRSTWHYVNYFWEQPWPGAEGVERRDLGRSGELVERLAALERTVGDRTLAASERAIQLAWVLHLVGDVHQPLHTSARVTAEEPEGDRGGNLFRLGAGVNLHAYWDRILMGAFAWPADEAESEYVARIVAAVEAAHPRASLEARVNPGGYEGWARDSWELARTRVYPASLERGRAPSEAYREEAYRISAEAVALAGYRLAELLDRLLEGPVSGGSGRAGADESVDIAAGSVGH